jgi:hypothetical protein
LPAGYIGKRDYYARTLTGNLTVILIFRENVEETRRFHSTNSAGISTKESDPELCQPIFTTFYSTNSAGIPTEQSDPELLQPVTTAQSDPDFFP